MKKAKILLASIAILGIVSGSLAFKAAEFGAKTYYTTADAGAIAPTANQIAKAITNTTVGTQVYWTTVPGTAANNFNTVTVGN